MTPTSIIEAARSLTDETLAAVLFSSLFILARRGAATEAQIKTMADLQVYLNPCLKDTHLRVA